MSHWPLSAPAATADTGAFGPHPTTPYFGSGNSFDVALGDLDGDGDLDAVVANYLDEPETVWLNDGAGAFGPHHTTPSNAMMKLGVSSRREVVRDAARARS